MCTRISRTADCFLFHGTRTKLEGLRRRSKLRLASKLPCSYRVPGYPGKKDPEAVRTIKNSKSIF
eukprot:1138334-Rhodomonas_salina.2